MRENTAWKVRPRLVERTRRVLGIVLLSTFASLPAWSAATEQRCQELGIGAACSCSETYDTTDWVGQQGGNANSSASPAATECFNTTGNWYPAADLVVVDETGMPGGNTVSKVWRNDQACGGAVASGDQMKNNTKRICIRAYHKLSADYLAGDANGGKWIEMTWDNQHSMQYGHNNYGAASTLSCRIIWDDPIFNCQTSGALTGSDCVGEWCRVEMCIEGDFVNETGNFYLEGYWERVRDGKRRDVPRQLMGDVETDIPESGVIWPVDMFRGCDNLTCRTPPCSFSGYREISHVMQAEWPELHPGLVIGPAYEVEGGAPGLPPPPPVVPPVVPPVAVPPPTTPPPAAGSLALTASAVADAGGARVTSVVSGGMGPYQFLFDCNLDGNWDGVVNSSQATAQHTCALNGQSMLQITAFAWDQTTNTSRTVIVQFSATPGAGPLGKPGQPSYVSP